MERPPLEVAEIFRIHGEAYRQGHGQLAGVQLQAMRAIVSCRTAALGGHLEECDRCGHQHSAYNSCRNRNCPKCQGAAARRWLERRQSELLPVPYFHVVFTVPQEVAHIALGNPKIVYGILFRCVSETLLKIAADPKRLGGKIGFLAILHTWGQNLDYHPHIHCVVPGGALSKDGGRWIESRKKFFLPVAVLSRMFRGKFLSALNSAFSSGKLKFSGKLSHLTSKSSFDSFIKPAAKATWVVYCKPPFGGPQQVLSYLGRYTHRIAISNRRLISVVDGKVTFSWRDYRDQSRLKPMTLQADEFIRRFLMHVVPSGFVRIRHYGLLANRNREASLQLIRSSLQPFPDIHPAVNATGNNQVTEETGRFNCPVCKQGTMKIVGFLAPTTKPMDSS